jgi:sialic acid synthase SpsE
MFLIEDRRLGPAEPVYVIAELGVNHNGDGALARELLRGARAAGADAAKLQLFVPEELATEDAAVCAYQKAAGAASQRSMLEALTLPRETLEILRDDAARLGITLFASVFDAPSIVLAHDLGFPAIKVGSGELTCLPLHEELCRRGTPVMLSCGMATPEEISPVVDRYRHSRVPVLLFHCVSAYPAPESELNLRSIGFLRHAFDVPVGFSDHTRGHTAACLALACGAVAIEKHLTLDRSLPGPDHQASAEPGEFAEMVRKIRETEAMLGTEGKGVAPSEREAREKVRKSIVLRHAVPSGRRLAPADLAFRRPGTGISPADAGAVVGRVTARDLPANHLLAWEDLLHDA